MAHDPEFDEALEAVFEEHAADFSEDLRDLLHQLFVEGIKVGRGRAYQDTAKLEQRLDSLQYGMVHDSITITAEAQGHNVQDISLETIRAAVQQLEQVMPQMPVRWDTRSLMIEPPLPEPPKREIFGYWLDEATHGRWKAPKKT